MFGVVFSKTASPLYFKVLHDTLGLRGAPGIAPVSWWWHHSRRRGGVLWRVGGGITQGDARIALAF